MLCMCRIVLIIWLCYLLSSVILHLRDHQRCKPSEGRCQSAKHPNVNSTATQAPNTNGSGVVNSGNETVSTRIAASKLLVMVLSTSWVSYLRLNFVKLFSICENGHKGKFNRNKCGVTKLGLALLRNSLIFINFINFINFNNLILILILILIIIIVIIIVIIVIIIIIIIIILF